MIYVREDLKPLFRQEYHIEDFLRIEGQLYKHALRSRSTLCFERGGRCFFLKAHWGVGWWEIAKNLFSLRLPVLGARNEWQAIQALEKVGVKTAKIAAYGERGFNPATRKSFLVTEALIETETLESWLPKVLGQRPQSEAFRLKRAMVHKLAELASRLHRHGINHRDFYLCHFRVASGERRGFQAPENMSIYVMDLHRAQIRHRTPRRWRVKDLGALLYSCHGLGLTLTDRVRFIEIYSGKAWRQDLQENGRFWRQVVKRAMSLERSDRGKAKGANRASLLNEDKSGKLIGNDL